MTNKIDESLDGIINRIGPLINKEDIKSLEFRYAIVCTELGDIGKYITHDQKINPGARPYGSQKEEELAYGQALVQILALAILKDVDIKKAIGIGLKNWEESDWRKKEAKYQDRICGIIGYPGSVRGNAYVVSPNNPIEEVEKGTILVTSTASPYLVEYFDKIVGFITDHGGKTSHAATMAREKGIPCIVGTGNATELIQHEKLILLKAYGNEGIVELLDEE